MTQTLYAHRNKIKIKKKRKEEKHSFIALLAGTSASSSYRCKTKQVFAAILS
jgi:lipid II:glycine glycyltransferase (peptidoglycan interpeptide bridge formation enzyme)